MGLATGIDLIFIEQKVGILVEVSPRVITSPDRLRIGLTVPHRDLPIAVFLIQRPWISHTKLHLFPGY